LLCWKQKEEYPLWLTSIIPTSTSSCACTWLRRCKKSAAEAIEQPLSLLD
jgi:hypothetical protein